jgi:cytochrome P450
VTTPNLSVENVLNGVVYGLYDKSNAQTRRTGHLSKLPLFDHPYEVDRIVKDHTLFRKNFSFISALGHSRFNSDGDEWATRRDITQPNYLTAAKPSKREGIHVTYNRHLADCDASFASIQRALFEASLTIFYGAFNMTPNIAPTVAILDRVRGVLRRLQYHSWVAPTIAERNDAIHDARDIIHEFSAQLLADPRCAAEMKRFAEAAPDIAGFSPVEEFVMNLFAGVETTVATASWVIDRLAVNEEVQSRIFSEIAADVADTPLTDCFISETMRYFPPIPFLIRETTAETTVGEHALAAGQLLLLSIVGVHHHSGFWEDPETFDSRRKEFMEDSFDRKAFIPFLTGPRMCGGARLGKMEVKEAVRNLVRRFVFRRDDNAIRFDYALALRPAKGSPVLVSRR